MKANKTGSKKINEGIFEIHYDIQNDFITIL